AAVLEKEAQPCPARQGIADRVGELGLLADQRQFLAQPGLERLDQGTTALLSNSDALRGGAAADLTLDPVKGGKAGQGFGGDRRGAALGEFVKVPTDMGPAESKLHLAGFGQYLVAGIAIDLQHATKAGEMRDWPHRFSVRGIDIGDDRRVGAAPWSVIAGIGEEVTGFSPASAGVENPRRASPHQTTPKRLAADPAAADTPGAAGTPRVRPSQPMSNGPGSRPDGHKSALAGTKGGGRRTLIPGPGRRSPRLAGHLRSTAPAPVPAP